MIHWEVGENDAKLLRDFLKEKGVSRRIIGRTKFHGGNFFVNGRKVHTREELVKGDQVVLELPVEEPNEYLFTSPRPITVLYEDENYLFLNKPAGLVSTPSRMHKGDTAAARVKYYLIKQGAKHQIVHTVTRLDRYTSGAMLFAKNMFVHSQLANLLEMNRLDREYLVLVKGHLQEKVGVIEAPIARSTNSIIERVVSEEGQFAKTSYQVLAELEGCTLVAAKLHTGRTHQIRVHFKHIGHPLIGDDLYDTPSKLISRQALHCHRLSFIDPLTHQKITQIAPLPKDMETAIKQTGGDYWLERDLLKSKKGFVDR